MSLLAVCLFSLYLVCVCAQNSLNISEDPFYVNNIEALIEDYDTNHESLIYRLCTHRSRFTEKELMVARVYLQTRFINGASIKPQRQPCKEIKVIRDFKCLTHDEKLEFISAFVKLYTNGVIDTVSYFHGGYWPFVHLLAQGFPWHKKFLLDLQQQIEKINPSVIIPYWDTTQDFASPEKSIVWDYFGHAGNASNDYCIPDGPFKNVTVKYPTPHCIRRQWNTDGTIPSWESPEVLSSGLQQNAKSYFDHGKFFASQHFKKHLLIGGYAGDISIPYATNEPLFHLFHIFDVFFHYFLWQLEDDHNLVPLNLAKTGKHVPPYDWNTTEIVDADLENDPLLYYNDTTIAEALSFGFGEFCYIPDQIVERINDIVNGNKPKLSHAVDNLRKALPVEQFATMYPFFAKNTANGFNHMIQNIGSSKTNRCKPLPLPQNFNATENGLRQYERFHQIGVEARKTMDLGEQRIAVMINTLNHYNYCSPYVY